MLRYPVSVCVILLPCQHAHQLGELVAVNMKDILVHVQHVIDENIIC